MRSRLFVILACAFLLAACMETEKEKAALPPPGAPAPDVPAASPVEPAVPQAPPMPQQPETPPIDIGDVDSGVFIRGVLAPESQSETTTVEYIETMRGTLSLTTITVKEPFPAQLFVRFELKSKRNFETQPVVVRARAYRGDNEAVGEVYACVLGSTAMQPQGPDNTPFTHAYTVNVLEGLDAPPETMLVHGRADAWLMPKGTVESLIDPRSAESPDQVPLMGNPVRINFIKGEMAL